MQKKPAVLFVAEGHTEYAFLHHLRKIYAGRNGNVVVTVVNAGGCGNLINEAKKNNHLSDYDLTVLFYDQDRPLSDEDQAVAIDSDYVQLISEPFCIEGFFLRVLGKRPGCNTDQCKKKIRPHIRGDLTRVNAYSSVFSKVRLVTHRESCCELDSLIKIFEIGR